MSFLRFRLRTLFVAVAVIAFALGGVVWLFNLYESFYYEQVSTVRTALAEHPEIETVWVLTNDDVQFEMEQLFFTVAGKPGVILGTSGVDGATKVEILAELDRALREQRPAQLPSYAEPWRWAAWK
jgi:hypothetical protein